MSLLGLSTLDVRRWTRVFSATSAVRALKSRPVRGFLSLLSLSYHSPLTTYYSLFFFAISASLREAYAFISRPFVPLTQDAKLAKDTCLVALFSPCSWFPLRPLRPLR